MQLNSGFWFTEQFSAALDGRNLVGAKLESKIRSSVILRGASIDAPEATVMGPEISRPALGVPPSTRLTVLPVAGSGEVWIRISGVPSGRWLIQYQNRLHSDQWLDEQDLEQADEQAVASEESRQSSFSISKGIFDKHRIYGFRGEGVHKQEPVQDEHQYLHTYWWDLFH
jgi:hypothetical protein